MADLLSLTFKLTQEQYDSIIRAAGELDVTRSELLRKGIEFWLATLMEAPSLVEYDRERLTRLAAKVGKIIAVLETN